ncbi:MAG: DUF427 domain-containing protein [bacterium]
MKAKWKNTLIAESDQTIVVENNHYFPPDSVNMNFLEKSSNTYECPWKGTATYYHIKVEDSINKDAAWTYENPKEAAQKIKNYFAFWHGVDIEE